MIKLDTDIPDTSSNSVYPFERLFDQIYIINLSTRTDRWENMKKKTWEDLELANIVESRRWMEGLSHILTLGEH